MKFSDGAGARDMASGAPSNRKIWSTPRVILSDVRSDTSAGPYLYFYEGKLTYTTVTHS